ncbi:unnamed protein product, partial [marine sediment metagenome]
VEGPVEIFSDVYSTGEIGTGIKEQAMVLKTEQGLIIITGCSHPGIVTVAKKAHRSVMIRYISSPAVSILAEQLLVQLKILLEN